jgi:hypothetical protein
MRQQPLYEKVHYEDEKMRAKMLQENIQSVEFETIAK